jgi:uncharacterized protein YoxC
MMLTLNQVLWIILTVAAVVAVTFLVLFLSQIRRTAREAERTLVKAQEMMNGLKEIEAKLNVSLDDVGQVLATSKKAVSGLSDVSLFLTSKVLRPSARFWPLALPLLSFGLHQLKKRKEKKDG